MATAAKWMTGKNWAETLTQMEAALEQAAETVRQRQRALDEYFRKAEAGTGPAVNWPQALEAAAERAQGLTAMAERAGQRVADVDAEIAGSERSLREWLAATEAARGKLADWLGRAIE